MNEFTGENKTYNTGVIKLISLLAVIILCASLRSATGETILQAIDSLKLSQAILLAIDVSSFIPFLPRIVGRLPADPARAPGDGVPSADPRTSDPITNFSETESVMNNYLSESSGTRSNFSQNDKFVKSYNVSEGRENRRTKKSGYGFEIPAEQTETQKSKHGGSDMHYKDSIYHKNNNFKNGSFPSSVKNGRAGVGGGELAAPVAVSGNFPRKNLSEDLTTSGAKNATRLLNADRRKTTTERSLLKSRRDGSFGGKNNGGVVSDREVRMGTLRRPGEREGAAEAPSRGKVDSLTPNDTAPSHSKNKTSNSGAELSRESNSRPRLLNGSGGDSAPNNNSKLQKHLSFKKKKIEKLFRNKRSWSEDRYEMFENISMDMKRSFMILTSMDSQNSVSDVFLEKSARNELFEHILEGLNTVVNGNADNRTVKVFKFLFLDWEEEIGEGSYDESTKSHWRPLIILQSTKNLTWKSIQGDMFHQGDVSLSIQRVQPNFDDWFQDKGLEFEEDSCYGNFCIRSQIKVGTTHVIIIVAGALLFCGLTIGLALIVR